MTGKRERLYTSRQVSDATGLDTRQIQFVTDNGVIPLKEGGGKRGQVRKFSVQGLKEFFIAAELMKFGVTIRVIKSFIEDFRKALGGIIDPYEVSMVKSATGKKIYPFIIFWIDPESKDGYTAKFQPNGLKKVMDDVKKLGLICFLIIDFSQIHSKVEGL